MRICLIDTVAHDGRRFTPHWTPLGLAYIAASLIQNGHRVEIVERDALYCQNGLSINRADALTANRIRRFMPDMVGISSPTDLFYDAAGVARIVKELYPDMPVIYGGHHATALPEAVLARCADMDMVVFGEGERTMTMLAAGEERRNLHGLCYRESGRIIKNAPRPAIDPLDALPIPARHLLDMRFHTKPSPNQIRNLRLRATTMMTSRGCPFHCSFCVESLPFGKSNRFHSTERVIEELALVVRDYAVEAIYFLDEGFLLKRQRVEDICRQLIQRGLHKRIRWAAQVRTDSIDPQILRLMKDAGCIQLECGFETSSDRLLHATNKNTSPTAHRDIIRMIKRAGIRCLANIIVGLPGETEVEFHETTRFIQNSGADHITFSMFQPHPGSRDFQKLVQEGALSETFWTRGRGCYRGLNFTAMPDDSFRRLYKAAWETIVAPINTRDRLRHQSIMTRIAELTPKEIAYLLKYQSRSFPKQVFEKLRLRRPA